MKHILWLYLMGVLLIGGVIGFFFSVAYETNGLREEISTIKTELKEAKDREVKFKTDIYTGMATLINGQRILSFGQLRIHHFVEPHSDKFYPGCQECSKEREEILDKDSVTGQ